MCVASSSHHRCRTRSNWRHATCGRILGASRTYSLLPEIACMLTTTSDSLRLVDVSIRADTVEFGIPVNGVTVYISGVVVGEKLSGQIWRQNTNVGSIQLTRKTVPVDKPPPG